MNSKLTSPSYMEFRLDLEGKSPLFLRVPTFWDEVEKQWIGVFITPETRTHVRGRGKTSFELQNDFNVNLSSALHSEISDEVFEMFKPLEYWEARSES